METKKSQWKFLLCSDCMWGSHQRQVLINQSLEDMLVSLKTFWWKASVWSQTSDDSLLRSFYPTFHFEWNHKSYFAKWAFLIAYIEDASLVQVGLSQYLSWNVFTVRILSQFLFIKTFYQKTLTFLNSFTLCFGVSNLSRANHLLT